jgi:ABC-type amino acid transport substrate-binding protein
MSNRSLGRRALLSLAMLGWPPLRAAAEPVLRTVAQAGAPVKYAPGDARRPGICAEILEAVERLDPGLRFAGQDRATPLRRIERMLAGGEIDAFFCLLRSPERARHWDYLPVPLYRVRHVAVQRTEDAAELPDYAALRAIGRLKPVLVAQGSVLAQSLRREQVPYSDAARSDLDALRMLLLGRSDAVYGQDMTLLPLLREPGLAGRLRVGAAVFHEDTQYAVTARHLPPETARRLGRALETLEREGFLRSLGEKYRQP